MKYRVLMGALAILSMGSLKAQEQEQSDEKSLYVKGNALFLPIGIFNLGIEKQISPKYTLQGDVFISRGNLLQDMSYSFILFLLKEDIISKKLSSIGILVPISLLQLINFKNGIIGKMERLSMMLERFFKKAIFIKKDFQLC